MLQIFPLVEHTIVYENGVSLIVPWLSLLLSPWSPQGHTMLWYLETLVGGPKEFDPFLKAYLDKFKYGNVGRCIAWGHCVMAGPWGALGSGPCGLWGIAVICIADCI